MSGITTCESITVLTQNGECEIELCLGDITKLTVEEKVDVLMVSAFLGNYVPTPRSVIGALQRNLGLCVENLAIDKEEDLRELYSCWWSKPLPAHLPYKRLLFSSSLPQVMVSDAFRCLVPILNNEDGSVITPLLNTGSQGYGKDGMIKGMVEAAVRWMKAGLPLRKLKIVLFAQKIEENAKDAAKAIGYRFTLEAFEQMKEKYDMQYMMPKEVKLEYDIYLSYSEADINVVQKIQEKLKKHKEDVRIFSTRQQLDQNSFWQDDMYEVMMKSVRVITVLTPNYLQTTACLEQYNIALCCNRKAHRDMLAPFYVITIENMPTYMGLVQYVDCRSQNAESINDACYQIIISLSINFTRSLSVMNASVVRYDLFLSYSHKDSEIAQKMVKMLQDLNSDLKIFFDVQELKTGKSWQRALYHSIDGSRSLVALVTNNYIKSPVCQEEFNLAMMKHYAVTNCLQLIPFAIEDINHLPPGFENVPQITTSTDTLEDNIKTLCSALVTWLETGAISEKDSAYHKYFDITEDLKFDITEKWETLRRKHFEEKFYNAQHVLPTSDFPPTVTDAFKYGKKQPKSDDGCDIVLSFNEDDKEYAEFLMSLLQHFAPKLDIQAKGKSEQERLSRIEGGKKIVPLLSPSYIESPEQVEELHIAIWRSRLSPNLIFPIHLHILPSRPAYFHLLDCPVNLSDSLWTELALKQGVVLPPKARTVVEGLNKTEEIALFMAAYFLLETIENERHEATPQSMSSKPALLNPFRLDANIKDFGPVENGQVPNTNTNHSGIADNVLDSFSELTSNAAIDKPDDEVSDTNKQHTEMEVTQEEKEVTTDVKEDTDSMVRKDDNKIKESSSGQETSDEPGNDKDQHPSSSKVNSRSGQEEAKDEDKREDEEGDEKKWHTEMEVTQEEKEVTSDVKEDTDSMVRKDDNEIIESSLVQKTSDEPGNGKGQDTSSSNLKTPSGEEKPEGSGRKSKTCNVI